MKKVSILFCTIACLLALSAWKTSTPAPVNPEFGDSISVTVINLQSKGFVVTDSLPSEIWFNKDGKDYLLFDINGIQTFVEYRSPKTMNWQSIKEVWDNAKAELSSSYELLSLSEEFDKGAVSAYGEIKALYNGKCHYVAVFKAEKFKVVLMMENSGEVKVKYTQNI